jgi:hypothetical protein
VCGHPWWSSAGLGPLGAERRLDAAASGGHRRAGEPRGAAPP